MSELKMTKSEKQILDGIETLSKLSSERIEKSGLKHFERLMFVLSSYYSRCEGKHLNIYYPAECKSLMEETLGISLEVKTDSRNRKFLSLDTDNLPYQFFYSTKEYDNSETLSLFRDVAIAFDEQNSSLYKTKDSVYVDFRIYSYDGLSVDIETI